MMSLPYLSLVHLKVVGSFSRMTLYISWPSQGFDLSGSNFGFIISEDPCMNSEVTEFLIGACGSVVG
jgi:hypothetical protein